MLISEFSRRTGLSRDTVRFYVRLGLLQPRASALGGRNPYQTFGDEDVQLAEVIRISQAMGMSLKEIVPLVQARREGRASSERSIQVLGERLKAVEQHARELDSIADYLRSKIAWLQSGKGPAPVMPNFADAGGNDASSS
jgi:MerR family transcriptional regulator, copper efflux regulator